MSNQASKPISGFPEFLPQEQIVFEELLGIIRRNYALAGFSPLETPAVERVSTLTSKGGNDKEIYALRRLRAEEGDTETAELALHFDLTVPLARYVGEHFREIPFPFRRYQIQKVWRGERPQSGRFREFYQCDIDVIGNGELSILNDAEIPSIIYKIFSEMKLGPFVIRVNNRKILSGFLASLGVAPESQSDALREVDKLEKIGFAAVAQNLEKIGVSAETAKRLKDFLNLGPDDAISALQAMTNMNDIFRQGVAELSQVMQAIATLGVPSENCRIDLSIARGLDYYTGTVYETILTEHPEIGSVCSGGRYDNLAEQFSAQKLPGVGVSIGLTRLFTVLLKKGVIKTGASTIAQVLVTCLNATLMPRYLEIARTLRQSGINTEVYFESKKIGDQIKYAVRKGFQYVVIAGQDEITADEVQLKNLAQNTQTSVKLRQLAEVVNGE